MKKTTSTSERYIILDRIGRGSYASVHKAIDRQTGSICAIKKISPMTSDVHNLISEIGIIKDCKSKYIVRHLDSECPGREVHIIMEYCCGGSVKDVMRQLGRTMNVDQITVILRDVLNGLEYLHSINKIHRDVKAANILLSEKGVAKLGDFGVSETCNDASRRQPSIIGTLLWLPPEVINQDPNYSNAIDIWSLGITIIEMGDGQPPFSDLEQSVAMKEIASLDKSSPTFKDPSKWPEALVNFVSLCLEKDATKRKCAKELLNEEIILNAPSAEIIQQLVAEVSTSTVNQTQSSMSRKYESLLKENIHLLGIYRERLQKVIRVDQMIDSHEAVEKEFKDLLMRSTQHNNRVNELRSQLKLLFDELQALEIEKNQLKTIYDERQKRKSNILRETKVIRDKQHEELGRRMKLKSLESE